MKWLSILLLAMSATACGVHVNDGPHDGDSDEFPDTMQIPLPTPAVPSETFQGYVGGAFAVNVDGTSYADMEDFYTQEQARLPAKVQAAGYDASWTARFDAQVGLSDLWTNMTVYVAPEEAQGFQGQTSVEDDGHFALTLPQAAVGHSYKVRANKRIGIALSRGATQIELCYNFSAVETSIPFTDQTLPIDLNKFVSKITTYDCSLTAGDGITVPAATAGAPPAASANVLVIGGSKADAARILGVNGLSVQSETKWCWAARPAADSACTLQKSSGPCDCSITFDSSGTISAFDGISASYLKAPAAPAS